MLEPRSSEFNVTRAYLDWLTCLPWGVRSEVCLSRRSLDRLQDVFFFSLSLQACQFLITSITSIIPATPHRNPLTLTTRSPSLMRTTMA